MAKKKLSHIDDAGKPRMVDVSGKADTVREATAKGTLRITPAVRERIWHVLDDWFPNEREASIVMLWPDPTVPGGQAAATLGLPPIRLIEIDGMLAPVR